MKLQELYDLTEKTALVIGASSGIGYACSLALAQAGAQIIGTGRTLDKLDKTSKDFQKKGYVFKSCALDLAEPHTLKERLKTILSEEKIDILIVIAGLNLPTPIFDQSCFENFDKVFQTNVYGMFTITQLVVENMKQHNLAGSIITTTSIRGKDRPTVHEAAYSASKGALIQMTKQLVGELSPHRIRINSMILGPVKTQSMLTRIGDKLPQVEKNIPLGFIAETEDLVGAFLYFASNKASRYVTGTSITLDGGLSWGGTL